jgi:hypothetical protein
MKEIILLLAMQFSQEFNRPIDNITYRIGDIDHIAIVRKTTTGYEITLDNGMEKMPMDRLRTIVYHATGKATGMDTTSNRRDFMNPKYILTPYKKLRH